MIINAGEPPPGLMHMSLQTKDTEAVFIVQIAFICRPTSAAAPFMEHSFIFSAALCDF